MQELLDTVLVTVAGLGTRSVLLAVMVALIVLTLVFGLATEDVLAGGKWEPKG